MNNKTIEKDTGEVSELFLFSVETVKKNQESTKKSGYSVYSPIIENREKVNELQDQLYPKLPKEKFDIIYCDPPWDYGGKTQFDKSIIKDNNVNYEKNIFLSSASFKYPTMKTKDLKKIPVDKISKDDCLLFMWTTNPHLNQAIELGNSWGFNYKTVAFIWNKMTHNPGQYTLSYCELCLLFKRGKIPTPRGARNVKQLINSKRRGHSQKPLEVRQGIDKMFPTQKKIELFAREKVKNWAFWGLEVS